MVFGLYQLSRWASESVERLDALRGEAAADLERLEGSLDPDDVRMLLLRHRDRLRRERTIARHLACKVRDVITLVWSWEQQKLTTAESRRMLDATKRLVRGDGSDPPDGV